MLRWGGSKKRTKERREPTMAEARAQTRDDGLRADPRDRPQKKKAQKSGARRGGRGKRRSRSLFGQLVYWCAVLGVWGVIAAAGVVAYYGAQLPPIDKLAIPKRPPNIAIIAEDGAVLANRGDSGGPAVHLSDMPPYLPKAFVAIEDRRFYAHWGLDPVGVARALVRNVLGRGGMQGGSTLTQQLAKNLFLTQERTISRKIQEAILALWLEHRYSKDQILELYLNRVYFGSGAYGVEAAARKYFGHGAHDVTLAEAAVLAGLMKAPTRLAPNRNPDGARERAAQVLTAMAQEGHITEAMAKAALARPAQAVRDPANDSINYAADYVMDALDDTIGAIDEDIVVTTTLSEPMQKAGEHALSDELDRKGVKFGVTQGALVALDPGGAIRALVGGKNYADSQFNRATAARRQPGSAFKPFVYLAALERGLTPDTVREDGPINIKGWRPENYSREYFGPVTLTNALALSLNTVAVRLGQEVGPRAVVRTARRLGVASDLQANASLPLGTSEVTPLELVGAYAPFANGGVGVQPYIITRVRTADGRLLYQRRPPNLGRVIEPQYVAMMNAMMQETLLTGTARKAQLPGWQAAGKTGTSQEFRDAWFVGYTSALVAGVWLGNDDSSPTRHASGGNLPVDVWSRFMKDALKGVPPQPLPGGTWRPVDAPAAPPADVPLAHDPAGAPAVASAAAPRPEATVAQQPGAPMQLGGAVHPQRRRAPPARADELTPPEDIGAPARQAQGREKNFLEKLFGG
ncbi:MAG: PBP1A family penicillin-binding protein [Hyphomicrobiales bacterium]|nr:PBP1A family penicillin-binding protein [Hyphomicrobiales bacterium]